MVGINKHIDMVILMVSRLKLDISNWWHYLANFGGDY